MLHTNITHNLNNQKLHKMLTKSGFDNFGFVNSTLGLQRAHGFGKRQRSHLGL